jgi:hypothetical protein
MDNEFVAEYHKVFPNASLNIFQMELIEAEIRDAEVWREAVTFWAGNGYRAQSVFKVIDYYKNLLAERNGKGKQSGKSNVGTLRESFDYFDKKYGS